MTLKILAATALFALTTIARADPLLAACNSTYNPRTEVRYLRDVPISVMFMSKKGESGVRPVPTSGLDALGFWWALFQRGCEIGPAEAGGGQSYFPRDGFALYVVLGAGFSLLTDEATKDATATPPLKETGLGGFLNGSAGILADWRWHSGGHDNHVAFGVFARAGYLFSGVDSRSAVMFGPAIMFEIPTSSQR